jgi:N-acetylglucosamine-6-phosphate deacetylase
MICSGVNPATGRKTEVEFGEVIQSAREIETGVEPGLYLSPGFVDLQINGFDGVDFNSPEASVDDLIRAVDAILRTGVTRCLPTIITGPPASMLACLRNIVEARRRMPHPAALAGFHMEGPHIDAADGPRGAHPAAWVRPPDFEEFQRWQEAAEGTIRIVTLSPHWPEAPRYIERLRAAGVVAAIGHTAASSAQIADAVDAGATLSTHLGNAAPRLLPKHPNCLWDQIAEDRLSASFIVDGFHLDGAFLRTALRAKGVERSLLVTDAAAPAGASPGDYRLGEMDVELTADERVVLRGQTRLAGSALRMNRAIGNVIRCGGLSLADALTTATLNPARLIQLPDRMQGLKAGEKGDVVVFRQSVFRQTDRIEIVEVYLDGVRVPNAPDRRISHTT